MALKLADVRNKTPALDDFSDEEISILREHKEELTSDEKQAFSSFLVEDEEEIDTEENEDTEEKENQTESEEDVDTDKGGADGGKKASDPESEEGKERKPLVFKTEEEARSYVDKLYEEKQKRAQTDEERASLSEERKKILDPINWFPEGYKADNPGQFAKDLWAKMSQAAQVEQQMSQEKRQEYEDQYNELIKEGAVPPLDTEEGKEVRKNIANLGIAHGKSNFREAYALWSMIPEDKGGGYKIGGNDNSEENEAKKQAKREQKKAASKVGGGSKGSSDVSKGKTGLKYSELKETSLDDLIDKALS